MKKKRVAFAVSAIVCLVTLLTVLNARDSQAGRNLDNPDSSTAVSVPEPVTMLLLGSGLVALTAGRRLARKKQQVSYSSPDKQ